jgi:hypothetical protein
MQLWPYTLAYARSFGVTENSQPVKGYSRTILAGAIAPTEATWAALMVLYTACLRYGVPETLISDSGGAYTSNDFEAVCTRLRFHHTTIVSTQGESYLNWMETHFNGQRRLYDYQFALTRTPAELEQRHQAFIQTYNTTAHQGSSLISGCRRYRWKCWGRPRAASSPRTHSLANLCRRCFRVQRISMGV